MGLDKLVKFGDETGTKYNNAWSQCILGYRGEVLESTISLTDSDVYNGDFRGILFSLGVPVKHHYPILILNEYGSYTDYRRGTLKIKMLSVAVLDSMLSSITGMKKK